MLTDFTESIQAAREVTLNKLLNLPSRLGNRCTSEKRPRCHNAQCNAQMHEALTSELERCNLSPKKKPSDIFDSVATLASLLEDLYIQSSPSVLDSTPGFGTAVGQTLLRHPKCDIDFSEKVEMIMDTVPDPTLECHIRHMWLRNGTYTKEELEALLVEEPSGDVVTLPAKPKRQLDGVGKRRTPHPHNRCARCGVRHASKLYCSLYR